MNEMALSHNQEECAHLPLHMNEDLIEVGIDEAGRGCLAGPVVVAGVILPSIEYIREMCTDEEEWNYHLNMLKMINDSKKLTEKKRKALKEYITSIALDYVTAFIPSQYIDEVNILQATIKGIKEVLKGLSITPQHALIDGTFPKSIKFSVPHTYILEGDAKFASIAAASILAKTFRDEYVSEEMHPLHPDYQWDKNKGYGTAKHYESIVKHGITDFHRKSFRLV